MNTAHRTAAFPSGDRERIEARLGLRIGALLEEQARRTPHDVTERLRVAREQALARARQSRVATAPAEVVVGRGASGTLTLGRQPSWLFRFASVMPLVVLVGGLLLIDRWHERAQIEAAADVDVALLADDLPPDAYSDAGFVEFLKQDPQKSPPIRHVSLRPLSITRCLRPVAVLALLASCALPVWSAAPAGGPSWGQLSPAEQTALAPLRGDWNELDANRRQKWLEVASRFGTMPPQQQERVRERMTDWARMTPRERVEARLNYQQTKQVRREDKQARWEAYQALPPEERAALAARAKPAPVAGGVPQVSPAQSLRKAPVDAFAPKSNIVSASPAAPPLPKPLGPTVVQGGPGATTRLLTAKPTPPAHQPPGEPKIAASPRQVDKTTLLPKSGAQAAGVQSVKTARLGPPIATPSGPPAPAPSPAGSNAQ